MSVRITWEEKEGSVKVTLIWPKHGNEEKRRKAGEVRRGQEVSGVIEVGLTVT